jgi:tellurite methyltransferase
MSDRTPDKVPVSIRDWDEKFSEKQDEWFFGREPTELARLTASYWKLEHGARPARVLDIGCGEGRDTVFFTQRGFEVTGVDGSESAMGKARRLAQDHDVTPHALICQDVQTFPITPDYDIYFSHNCIQFLGEGCLPYLRKIQDATPAGGFNSISAFSREAESLVGQPGLYRFDSKELKFHYQGWRLLYYDEVILWRDPMNDYLSFARIIAQKVSAPPGE